MLLTTHQKVNNVAGRSPQQATCHWWRQALPAGKAQRRCSWMLPKAAAGMRHTRVQPAYPPHMLPVGCACMRCHHAPRKGAVAMRQQRRLPLGQQVHRVCWATQSLMPACAAQGTCHQSSAQAPPPCANQGATAMRRQRRSFIAGPHNGSRRRTLCTDTGIMRHTHAMLPCATQKALTAAHCCALAVPPPPPSTEKGAHHCCATQRRLPPCS